MNKKELNKAFSEGLITEEKYKEELFKLETAPKKERQKKKLPVAITPEEFGKLIQHTKKKHHKVSFLLGFGAGLRISEITNLEQRDIHLKEKRIDVRQGKGGKDRPVPLPKGFKDIYVNLFPVKCGARALEIAFKSAAKRAGLLESKPTLHFHSLRHGFATHMISQGVPIHHIRTLMGHSNISTTNIYLVSNPTDALRSYEDLF